MSKVKLNSIVKDPSKIDVSRTQGNTPRIVSRAIAAQKEIRGLKTISPKYLKSVVRL